MPKIGRPKGPKSKSSITRSICLPADLYKKCMWIADKWTKDSLLEFDGTNSPEYWTMPKVVASILSEYFEALESQDPTLVEFFKNCQNR